MDYEIEIKYPLINLNLIKKITDKRQNSHPEKNNWDNFQKCIDQGIAKLGVCYYPPAFFDLINNVSTKMNHLSKLSHYFKILGNMKGVINYTRKHGKSTLSRYIEEYEGINILLSKQMLKINGRIVWGLNAWPRIELVDHIKDLCNGIPNPKILEAGCGSGLNMFMLNRSLKSSKIDGFEYTHARLATSIINLVFEPNIGNLFLGDITKIDLPDNYYDVVFTNHVIEQLGQKLAPIAIREVLRVSKKGVVLVEPTLHNANYYERWRLTKLGYCEDLLSIANSIPGCRVKMYKEDTIRNYPNTSNTLVLEKNS